MSTLTTFTLGEFVLRRTKVMRLSTMILGMMKRT
jgi:hypothetical protein